MTPTEALQAWLALEHEAVWLHPVIGARFRDLLPQATKEFEMHRGTRDGLLRRIGEMDTEPAPTRLTYDMGPLSTAQEARQAARGLESRIAAACLTLAGVAEGDLRAYAITNLTRAALAELAWGAKPKAFPGLP